MGFGGLQQDLNLVERIWRCWSLESIQQVFPVMHSIFLFWIYTHVLFCPGWNWAESCVYIHWIKLTACPSHWMMASAPSVGWPASMYPEKSPRGSRWYTPLTGNSTGLDWGGGGGSGGLLVSSAKLQFLTAWLYLAMAAARSSWGNSRGCSGTWSARRFRGNGPGAEVTRGHPADSKDVEEPAGAPSVPLGLYSGFFEAPLIGGDHWATPASTNGSPGPPVTSCFFSARAFFTLETQAGLHAAEHYFCRGGVIS